MKKTVKARITMEDHRRAVGKGCYPEEYARRLGIDEIEAARLISVLSNLPAIKIDDDGKLRWLP